MSRLFSRTTLAFAALLLLAAPAMASSTTFRRTGTGASATFNVQETKPCGTGTATVQTFVSADAFETTVRFKGTLTTVIQTVVFVSRFDFCTGQVTTDFGIIAGGQLQLNSLTSAVLTGHFVLDEGTVVDLNLTLTGSGTTTQGVTMTRDSLGGGMTITHSVGSSRTATVSGSVTINGITFGSAQLLDAVGNLSRSTSGETTILKP